MRGKSWKWRILEMGKKTGWPKTAGNWILDNPKRFGRLLWMVVGIVLFVLVVEAWSTDVLEKKYVGIVSPNRIVAGDGFIKKDVQLIYKDCSDLKKPNGDVIVLGVYDYSDWQIGFSKLSYYGPKLSEGDLVEVIESRYFTKTNPHELIRTSVTARLIKAGYCKKSFPLKVF
jgi:hypothetical protein